MFYRFHIALFAREEGGWGQTFEETQHRLEQLPGMFTELDGSFAWTPEAGVSRVEGVLYDRNGRMFYVECKGKCTPGQFDQFLAALGHPADEFRYQMVREGVYVAADEFRRMMIEQPPEC